MHATVLRRLQPTSASWWRLSLLRASS